MSVKNSNMAGKVRAFLGAGTHMDETLYFISYEKMAHLGLNWDDPKYENARTC
jgi:hypothetical protein